MPIRAKILNGKVKVEDDANISVVIGHLKNASGQESKVMSGIDATIQALYRAEYRDKAQELENLKRNIKSIFTWAKGELQWLT